MEDDETVTSSFCRISLQFSGKSSIVTGFRVFEKDENKFLFTWSHDKVHVFLFSVLLTGNYSEDFTLLQLIDVKDTNEIFLLESDVFLLDINGQLSTWKLRKNDRCLEDEMDMFADEEEESRDVSPVSSSTVQPLLSGVVCACISGNKLTLVRKAGSNLVLEVYDQGGARKLGCIPLKSTITYADVVSRCHMISLKPQKVDKALRAKLWPQLSLEKEEGLILCLGDRGVFTLFLSRPESLMLIFYTPSPIIAIAPAGEGKKVNKILVYHGSVSVTVLKVGDDEKLQNNTTSIIWCTDARSTKQYIFFCPLDNALHLLSDGNRLHRIETKDLRSSLLPVRGVVAMCGLKSRLALLSTRHRTLYSLSLSTEPTPCDLPISDDVTSLLKEIDKCSLALAEVKAEISAEDAMLKELGISNRASYLENKFDMKAKIFVESSTVIVEIVNISGVEFASGFWSFLIIIQGKKVDFSHSANLKATFKVNEMARVKLNMDSVNISPPLDLTCQLVFVPGVAIIKVGKIVLDVSYFFNPVSSASMVHEYSNSHEPKTDSITSQHNPKSDIKHRVHLKLPEEIGLEELAPILSKNCFHNSPGTYRTSQCLAFCVQGSRIEVQVGKEGIEVVCDDLSLAHQVRSFVSEQLRSMGKLPETVVTLDPEIFLQAENLKLALDLAEAEGEISEQLVLNLYKKLRSLTSQLPIPS